MSDNICQTTWVGNEQVGACTCPPLDEYPPFPPQPDPFDEPMSDEDLYAEAMTQ